MSVRSAIRAFFHRAQVRREVAQPDALEPELPDRIRRRFPPERFKWQGFVDDTAKMQRDLKELDNLARRE